MVMVSSASLDTIVVGDVFVLYNTLQWIAFECGCLCQLHTHLLATVLLLQLWDSCPIESSVLPELLHSGLSPMLVVIVGDTEACQSVWG